MVITSSKNDYVRMLASLASKKGRLQNGLYLVEGVKMVKEALLYDQPIKSIAFTDTKLDELIEIQNEAIDKGIEVFVLKEFVMAAASDVKTSQGVVAAISLPSFDIPDAFFPDIILAMEGIQDPGNVGTMIRTAEAAGVDAIMLSSGCCDVVSPKVIRSCMGSMFRMPVYKANDFHKTLGKLKENGYDIALGDVMGENVFDKREPINKMVLVIGSEGRGVSQETMNIATKKFRVPMVGNNESLNASVAGGILLYQLLRDRLMDK